MKKLLLISLCLAVFTAFAQSGDSSEKLLTSTEWINENLDYLRFDNNIAIFNFDNTKQVVNFDLNKKTLSFKVNYRVAGMETKTEEFTFKIKELRKNKLILEPLVESEANPDNYKKLNIKPLTKEKQYILYNRGHIMERTNFQKITFHASTCYGTCPSFSVEINRDGTVFYKGIQYTSPYIGYYVGQLSKEEIYSLRKILNRSQLENIKEKWHQQSEPNNTPRYNYIIELDKGEKFYLNTNDQHPVLDRLSQYIRSITEKADLQKAEGMHEFEQSPIDKYKVQQF
ncbi:MAG: hypothetical protein CR985_01570 [Flavobacteriales bacterium]|nr:MAG: hypothetical protein CR985_01570 [Flavobacteriales bacterium]